MTDLHAEVARLLGAGPYYDPDRDVIGQGNHYMRHVMAMTGERLHSKSAIAQELAHRDQIIERLDARVREQAAEIERLRTGDTCGRQCEGTAYRIELGQAKREIERLRTRVAELERALGPAMTREAEDMGLYDETRADVIGQNGNEGLHYTEADAGPTPLRGRVTRRSE